MSLQKKFKSNRIAKKFSFNHLKTVSAGRLLVGEFGTLLQRLYLKFLNFWVSFLFAFEKYLFAF
jgi:hypothetical protein